MNQQTKPQFRVARSGAFQTHDALRDEILAALEPILFGSISEGYAVRHSLEYAFAQEMGHSYAVAVHSGTIGLFLALQACQIQTGDEVITVSNSDISTTAAIHQCGAVSVLCDVLESDFTINPDLVEKLITDRTRAILPVDLYGHPANASRLREIADRHHLIIIQDAALAAGAYDNGKPVGAYADATVFSFAPFKPLGSVANGAMVVTDDPDVDKRLRLLNHYGNAVDGTGIMPGTQHYIAEGYNVPLDTLQAALVSVKLPYLAEWTARRQAVAQMYAEGLADTSAITPQFRPESSPTFRAYTIRVERQGDVHRQLRNAGVEAVLHYTPPIYKHPVYQGRLPGSDALPITDQLANELICLPVSPELTDADVDYVISVLRDLLA